MGECDDADVRKLEWMLGRVHPTRRGEGARILRAGQRLEGGAEGVFRMLEREHRTLLPQYYDALRVLYVKLGRTDPAGETEAMLAEWVGSERRMLACLEDKYSCPGYFRVHCPQLFADAQEEAPRMEGLFAHAFPSPAVPKPAGAPRLTPPQDKLRPQRGESQARRAARPPAIRICSNSTSTGSSAGQSCVPPSVRSSPPRSSDRPPPAPVDAFRSFDGLMDFLEAMDDTAKGGDSDARPPRPQISETVSSAGPVKTPSTHPLSRGASPADARLPRLLSVRTMSSATTSLPQPPTPATEAYLLQSTFLDRAPPESAGCEAAPSHPLGWRSASAATGSTPCRPARDDATDDTSLPDCGPTVHALCREVDELLAPHHATSTHCPPPLPRVPQRGTDMRRMWLESEERRRTAEGPRGMQREALPAQPTPPQLTPYSLPHVALPEWQPSAALRPASPPPLSPRVSHAPSRASPRGLGSASPPPLCSPSAAVALPALYPTYTPAASPQRGGTADALALALTVPPCRGGEVALPAEAVRSLLVPKGQGSEAGAAKGAVAGLDDLQRALLKALVRQRPEGDEFRVPVALVVQFLAQQQQQQQHGVVPPSPSPSSPRAAASPRRAVPRASTAVGDAAVQTEAQERQARRGVSFERLDEDRADWQTRVDRPAVPASYVPSLDDVDAVHPESPVPLARSPSAANRFVEELLARSVRRMRGAAAGVLASEALKREWDSCAGVKQAVVDACKGRGVGMTGLMGGAGALPVTEEGISESITRMTSETDTLRALLDAAGAPGAERDATDADAVWCRGREPQQAFPTSHVVRRQSPRRRRAVLPTVPATPRVLALPQGIRTPESPPPRRPPAAAELTSAQMSAAGSGAPHGAPLPRQPPSGTSPAAVGHAMDDLRKRLLAKEASSHFHAAEAPPAAAPAPWRSRGSYSPGAGIRSPPRLATSPRMSLGDVDVEERVRLHREGLIPLSPAEVLIGSPTPAARSAAPWAGRRGRTCSPDDATPAQKPALVARPSSGSRMVRTLTPPSKPSARPAGTSHGHGPHPKASVPALSGPAQPSGVQCSEPAAAVSLPPSAFSAPAPPADQPPPSVIPPPSAMPPPAALQSIATVGSATAASPSIAQPASMVAPVLVHQQSPLKAQPGTPVPPSMSQVPEAVSMDQPLSVVPPDSAPPAATAQPEAPPAPASVTQPPSAMPSAAWQSMATVHHPPVTAAAPASVGPSSSDMAPGPPVPPVQPLTATVTPSVSQVPEVPVSMVQPPSAMPPAGERQPMTPASVAHASGKTTRSAATAVTASDHQSPARSEVGEPCVTVSGQHEQEASCTMLSKGARPSSGALTHPQPPLDRLVVSTPTTDASSVAARVEASDLDGLPVMNIACSLSNTEVEEVLAPNLTFNLYGGKRSAAKAVAEGVLRSSSSCATLPGGKKPLSSFQHSSDSAFPTPMSCYIPRNSEQNFFQAPTPPSFPPAPPSLVPHVVIDPPSRDLSRPPVAVPTAARLPNFPSAATKLPLPRPHQSTTPTSMQPPSVAQPAVHPSTAPTSVAQPSLVASPSAAHCSTTPPSAAQSMQPPSVAQPPAMYESAASPSVVQLPSPIGQPPASHHSVMPSSGTPAQPQSVHQSAVQPSSAPAIQPPSVARPASHQSVSVSPHPPEAHLSQVSATVPPEAPGADTPRMTFRTKAPRGLTAVRLPSAGGDGGGLAEAAWQDVVDRHAQRTPLSPGPRVQGFRDPPSAGLRGAAVTEGIVVPPNTAAVTAHGTPMIGRGTPSDQPQQGFAPSLTLLPGAAAGAAGPVDAHEEDEVPGMLGTISSLARVQSVQVATPVKPAGHIRPSAFESTDAADKPHPFSTRGRAATQTRAPFASVGP